MTCCLARSDQVQPHSSSTFILIKSIEQRVNLMLLAQGLWNGESEENRIFKIFKEEVGSDRQHLLLSLWHDLAKTCEIFFIEKYDMILWRDSIQTLLLSSSSLMSCHHKLTQSGKSKVHSCQPCQTCLMTYFDNFPKITEMLLPVPEDDNSNQENSNKWKFQPRRILTDENSIQTSWCG